MGKDKIIRIAKYCSDHECPMNIRMRSGEVKNGIASHLVESEFLFIKCDAKIKNDLVKISEVDSVECALKRIE